MVQRVIRFFHAGIAGMSAAFTIRGAKGIIALSLTQAST
jgi:hypothetical protein